MDRRVVIQSVQPGTVLQNIKCWTHRIKNAHLLKIYNIKPTSIEHANKLLKTITKDDKTFTITI